MSFYDMLRAGASAGSSIAVNSALAKIVNEGPKNLLKIATSGGKQSTITFTHNTDGTVTASASSASSNNTDHYLNESLYLPAGTYKLTGCPSGGNNNSTFKIQISGVGYDVGDGKEFTLDSDRSVSVYIRVWAGYVPSDVVFSPMICPIELYNISDEFVQYIPSNKELYEMILAMQE